MFPINFVFWSCADRKVLNRERDRECLKESTCYFLFIGLRLYTGVICLYRYFEIFLLVLISFPTAKSFLQRIFTPKKIFGPSYIFS